MDWAIIIAVVAVLTFLINFVVKPLITKGKLNVDAVLNQQMIQAVSVFGGMPTSSKAILVTTITNTGSTPVYIKNIGITASSKVDGYDQWTPAIKAGTFPMKLEAGQPYKHHLNMHDLYSQVLHGLDQNDTVRVRVFDSKGKAYLSQKIKVKDIVIQVNVANSFTSEQFGGH